ncbi:MAG TPA: class I SAM-dependent methyltransferase [Pyrinomonadaceae bacterium]|nr:class I SAM-dependent methyltransferase [Pyrinomonadaceae bacterium]
MNCPLCNSESKLAFEAKGFRLHDCTRCGHRFTAIAADEKHVSEVYSDDYFSGGGAGYSDYLAEGEMLNLRGRMYAEKIAKFRPEPGKMLDVGAAAGFILRGFIDSGWQGTGLEPNAEMAKFGAKALGLHIRKGSLESIKTNDRFDLVSMIQVAAHFYDPRSAFEKARDLLVDDGLLLIETWNRESISARVFGKNWHEYSPPSVLQFFSEKGLTKFLETVGFEKIGGGRPSKKISGEHARSLLKYRIGDNRLLKLIPAKINFPYPSEDLFWAVYRKKQT